MNPYGTLLIMAAVLLSASSCASKRTSLAYFNDLQCADSVSFNLDVPSLTIVPADQLFITVNSYVPEATAQYNLPLVNPATSENIINQANLSQPAYVVDDEGFIVMPAIGRIQAAGLTTRQLKDSLTEIISEEVIDPIVRVELINFGVDILGEVKQPGRYKMTTERVTILDALALAGDMTEYGSRDNVIVIREVGGQRTVNRLNLNKSDIFRSPYFYLRQNDAVYVVPNEIRQANSKYNLNNAYKLSVTSTVVGAASVIASLIIALTVK